MADGPRKRTSEREPTSPRTTATPIDEFSPIITHAQATAKDYNSTSPSIPPQNSTSSTSRDPAFPSNSKAKPTHAQEDGASAPDPRRSNSQRRSESAEREAAAEEQREGGRWRAFWEKYGSVELENKGSVARDHLALGTLSSPSVNHMCRTPFACSGHRGDGDVWRYSRSIWCADQNFYTERTFLAWLRTSLSFASIGIAITQLFRLNTSLSNKSSNSSSSSQHILLADSPQARIRHLGKPLGATFIAISIVMLFIGFHRYFEAQHYVIRGKFPASRGSIMVVSAISGALIASSLVVILVTAPSVFEK